MGYRALACPGSRIIVCGRGSLALRGAWWEGGHCTMHSKRGVDSKVSVLVERFQLPLQSSLYIILFLSLGTLSTGRSTIQARRIWLRSQTLLVLYVSAPSSAIGRSNESNSTTSISRGINDVASSYCTGMDTLLNVPQLAHASTKHTPC